MNTFEFDLQGHRGARGLRSENTIPAFELAMSLGVTTLEMDTVISRDRKVVISHDSHFSSEICSRPNGIPVSEADARDLRLFEMTYEEIRAFDCGSRQHQGFPEQIASSAHKPLLSEVLTFAESRAVELGRAPLFYNIETKSTQEGDHINHPPPNEFTDLVLDSVTQCGVTDRVIIQSFDERTLQRTQQSGIPVRTALLVDRNSPGDFGTQINNLGFPPDIYSPEFSLVDESLMVRAAAAGIAVLPWTVNKKSDMLSLISLGVRGMITDYPNRGIQVLRERGLKY